MTALKSLIFLILAPGLLGVYVPLAFLRTGPQLETGFFSYLAFPLWLIGGLTLLWCFWDFTFKGCGTPAPIDPPKELVASGLYRLVRNPMYVGVLLLLAGHFLIFRILGALGLRGILLHRHPSVRHLVRGAGPAPALRGLL